MVGGTGLYSKAWVDGIWDAPEADPALRQALEELADRKGRPELHRMLTRLDPDGARVIHPNDIHKTRRALEITLGAGKPASVLRAEHGFPGRYAATILGLTRPRAELYARIDRRVEQMLADGWMAETRALIDAGVPLDAPGMNALGYRDLAACLAGETTLEEATETIKKTSRHYAKRQFTWFRKDARIRWLNVSGVSVPDWVAGMSDAKNLDKMVRVHVTVCKTP